MDIECKQGRHFNSTEDLRCCPRYPCSKCTSDSLKIEPMKKNKQCPACLKYSILPFGFSEYCNNPYCTDYRVYKIPIQYIVEETITVEQELQNPLLLGVKMFLADIRTWRNQYVEDEYVCIDFSNEVVNKATEIGMRCGLVHISFKQNDIGHAIVAFETDQGLIFIEPQNGEEVDIRLNKPYSTGAEGFQENNVIESVRISWNDGTKSRI